MDAAVVPSELDGIFILREKQGTYFRLTRDRPLQESSETLQ